MHEKKYFHYYFEPQITFPYDSVIIIQYSSNRIIGIVEVRDHGGLGLSAQKYLSKPASHFLFNSLAKPKCLQMNPKPSLIFLKISYISS